jgi:hypothetical protein
MSDLVVSQQFTAKEPATQLCQLCRSVDCARVAFEELPEDMQKLVQANVTSSQPAGEVCVNCIGVFTRAQTTTPVTAKHFCRRRSRPSDAASDGCR